MVQLTSLWSFSASSAVAATAAAATTSPPTADSFESWSTSAQITYLSANSTDDPPFLVIGDPSGAQILATLSWDGKSVDATPVPASYATAVTTGVTPTADAFQGWDPELQLTYLRAAGIDASSSLVLGGPSGAQALATLSWDGRSVVTTPVPASYTTAVSTGSAPTSTDFEGWPQALQLAYLKARSTDNPPFLILSDSGGAQTLVTPSADGTGVSTALVPQSYRTTMATHVAPSASDAASWPSQLQLSFLRTGSTYKPPFLVIGDPSGSQTLATLGAGGNSVVSTSVPQSYSTAVSTGVAPSASDAANWPTVLQLSYLRTGSTDDPPFLVIGDPSGTQTLDTLSSDENSIVTATVSQSFSNAVSAQVAPSIADFQGWPSALQLSYLRTTSTDVPPFLVIGDPGGTQLLATLGSDGRSVVSTAVPQSYSDASSGKAAPTADDFQGWAPQLQLAYLRLKGTGTPKSLLFGTGQEAYTASVTASGTAVSVIKGDPGAQSYWGTATVATTATAASPFVSSPTSTGGQILVTTPDALSTTGMADNTIPYYSLPGAVTGLASSTDQTVANVLFPVLNGDPTVAGSTILPTNPLTDDDKTLVAQFNTAPSQLDASTFGSWNSAIQLQYLRANAGLQASDGTLAIGIAGSTNGVVHVFMSTATTPQLTQQKVYVVENLQKIDIAQMAYADQQNLAGMSTFQVIARSLNLVPDGTSAVAPGQTGVDTSGNALPKALELIQQQITKALAMIGDPTQLNPSQQNGMMPASDKLIFTDEINLIDTQTKTSAIYSPTDIQTQLDTITARFARANAFSIAVNVPGQRAPEVDFSALSVTVYNGISHVPVTLLPSDQILVSGKQMSVKDFVLDTYTIPLPADNSVVTHAWPPDITLYSSVQNPSLDYSLHPGPSSYKLSDTVDITFTRTAGNPASLDGNATIASGYNTFITQEQQVLSLAQRAQSLATTGKLTTQNLDGPNLVYLFQLFANLTGEAVVRMDTEEVSQTNALLQMYTAMQQAVQATLQALGKDQDSGKDLQNAANGPSTSDLEGLFTGTPTLNPIEILKGIPRAVNTNGWNQTSTQWNSYNQVLSNAVSSINQDSQIKMNDINDETKQKDRNFDLANSALQKAQDTLSKIASM